MPGCPRWSRRYRQGVPWICGRHWKEVTPQSRRVLRYLWRRMRDAWAPYEAWDDLPWSKQEKLRALDRLERKVWARAIQRAMLKAAGL